MKSTRIFIDRPVATTLLMVALALCGLLALWFLPVSALPNVDFPTIEVVTLYPGASPDVMASSVTAPLEKQFGQMPGLDQMGSTSSAGASVIVLRFNLGLGLDVAEQEVQEGINMAALFLPTDLPMPPVYNKVNPADTPILTLAVTTSALPLPALEDMVDTRLAAPLSQVSGVGLVSLQGGQRPAVRLQLDAAALAARGLSFEDVRTFIQNANVNMPKGLMDGPSQASTLDINDQLNSAAEYRNLVIAWQNGAAVHLSDVTRTVDGAENTHLAAGSDGHPALLVSIQRQPGANVLATVAALRQKLQQLEHNLPPSVQVQVIADRTISIRASVHDVSAELIFAIALVVMVIFLFLRTIPATIIPAIAVPLSLLGSLGVMYLAGMSINNLTLMAMTVATGFVVDDAIVMVENIARLCESGLTPYQAAVRGARQMGFTIISLTVSLIAVLIPLLFMHDVIGRLFREFSLTLVIAIVISALVSLSLTPMLSARLLRSPSRLEKAQPLNGQSLWGRLLGGYERLLIQALDHRHEVLILLILSFLLTAVLYHEVSKGFFPEQDTGAIEAMTRADPSISFRGMQALQEQLVAAIRTNPAVLHVASTVGIDGTNNAVLSQGRLLITLVDKADRPSMSELEQQILRSVRTVAGIHLWLKPVQDVSVDDQFSASAYRIELSELDADELHTRAQALLGSMQQDTAFAAVHAEYDQRMQSLFLQVNRDTASRLGVSMADVDNLLYDAFGQRLISTIFTQANQYRVVLELKPGHKSGWPGLHDLYLHTTHGMVRLDVLAHWQQQPVPESVAHLGQFPAVTIGFDLSAGVSLDQAMQHLQHDIEAQHFPLRLNVAYQGALRAFVAALSNQLWLLLAAVVTMYIVLGVLYESFVHPLTILSTLPSAAMGALGILYINHQPLDVLGLIGIVLLIGIVKKNAIMMIDFALDAQRHRALSPRDAIHEACLLRFRPILMTTFCALVGALPLLWGNTMGAELRQPLGLTLVGGLLISQILTLFTTPVLYLTVAQWKSAKSGVAS